MDLDSLANQPARRRLWLLIKALECTALDRALDLARTAEEFVAAVTTDSVPANLRPKGRHDALAESAKEPECNRLADTAAVVTVDQPKSTRLPIPSDRREELLDRLACGAKNADLATEFGLTPKQVQGARMGAAREITRRRGGGKIEPSEGQYRGELSSSSEEIIRYLRQQDDVVVPERNDTFLVNGRFHLRLDELAARANRMRRRQNKPLFRVHEVESQASQLIATETNNGAAPMFRTETRRLERVTA